MTNYLVPSDAAFVEHIARAMARDRLLRDTLNVVGRSFEDLIDCFPEHENPLNFIFDRLWEGTSPEDERQKENYRSDARIAISAINLKLLTATA